MYGFEERENVLKELLNKAETMSHLSPRIALRIFECSISIFGKKDSEPVLIKAKALARKLQGEERDEAFRMIIECEMKYNLPSALGTYNELKSFSE